MYCRSTILVIAALVVGCGGSADTKVTTAPALQAGDPAKADLKNLQGEWVPQKGGSEIVWAFQDDTLTIYGAKKESWTKHAIVLDPSKSPKAINLHPMAAGIKAEKAVPGIYKLDGDNLTVRLSRFDKLERPTDFPSKPGDHPTSVALVLKRVK